MLRITFAGAELEGLEVTEPAASVRLLLPSPGTTELVIPEWNGNEFLLPGGERPAIRTFTPLRVDPAALEMDIDMVIHHGGVASAWARSARPGSPAAVSGPGRGYRIDPDAKAFLLAGDETAIPAISQLLGAIPDDIPVEAHIEVSDPAARVQTPRHAGTTVQWHDLGDGAAPGETLVEAITGCDLGPDIAIWCAGEAAAMHRIRKHLFDERGVKRSQATVRGYWKLDRRGAD